MEEASDEAMVNFYKCGACGHAWTTSKIDPSIMRHLTPLTKTRGSSDPSLATIVLLAHALGCEVADLFQGQRAEPRRLMI